MGYRIVTPDASFDFDDSIKATVNHCRNICLNVTSALMQTFDDALPDEVVRGARLLDTYTASPVRAERERRLTWTLGDPQPAFPEPGNIPAQQPDAFSQGWRSRAFYYALGQIESMWDLSPLSEGDAVSFSYHFQGYASQHGTVSNADLRDSWEEWSAARRRDIEVHGKSAVVVGGRAPQPGVDYLEGGEHDPTLGPDMSDGR